MRRLVPTAVVLAALAWPATVEAHALVGRVKSPLPLVVYLAGAAIAVALSFALVMAREVREPSTQSSRAMVVPSWIRRGLRGVGLLAWVWIAAQTLVGGSSDADVSSLFLWVYGWVGLALVSAFIGPAWTWLDPFVTLYDLGATLARRANVRGWTPTPYPRRLGAWPAVVGFTFFIWLELVYQGGSIGIFLLIYTVLTLLAMMNFGRDVWRERGETFSVWFRILGRMAPLHLDGDDTTRVRRRPLGSGLFIGGWSAPSVVMIALGTGSILFDGLSQTEPWFMLFGLPPMGPSTVLLLGFLALVAGTALAVARLVGLAAIGAGLAPIAVGYLAAHYLTYLLGDGQRIVIAISDPLQLGWDLFGTAFFEPGTAWIPPVALWTAQLAAVVGGHMVGAWAGHVMAGREGTTARSTRLRELPLAILMVALTAVTLWSLGQAVVDEPETAESSVEVVARG